MTQRAKRINELTVKEGREVAERYPYSDSASCGERINGICGVYTCTRREKHDGPHVAHAPGLTAVATWNTQESR